ncbi:tyrosine-type recombinase/integrase [Paenibacillus mesotrionivorans]|uniref:Tyrosine-type recombinase/integrase n=1 Tax=Paenibacillus mesotrionivorans TaxID=3160968 RepID=A0ACC7PB37_9BACL
MFVSVDNQPLQTRSLQDRIHGYGLMTKITGVRVSPHTFRHTMAKMYIRNGDILFLTAHSRPFHLGYGQDIPPAFQQ